MTLPGKGAVLRSDGLARAQQKQQETCKYKALVTHTQSSCMRRDDVWRIYDDLASRVRARKLPVKLPSLVHGDGSFTVAGLTLVFFASRMGDVGRKAELNTFLRTMRCTTTDPQPRHLGMQLGFNFIVKGCFHPKLRRTLKSGEFSLLDLGSVHPSFERNHRVSTLGSGAFVALKRAYQMRCACCGSKEGDRHLKNAHAVTKLEKGHRDPRRPLTTGNCIPMCTLCNGVYKDHAVFNHRGFVVRWLGEVVQGGGGAGGGRTGRVVLMKKKKKKTPNGTSADTTAAATRKTATRKTATRKTATRKTTSADTRNTLKSTATAFTRTMVTRSMKAEHEGRSFSACKKKVFD